jgi:hypothetical protein
LDLVGVSAWLDGVFEETKARALESIPAEAA